MQELSERFRVGISVQFFSVLPFESSDFLVFRRFCLSCLMMWILKFAAQIPPLSKLGPRRTAKATWITLAGKTVYVKNARSDQGNPTDSM